MLPTESVEVVVNNPINNNMEDVISALVNLGYQRMEAYKVVVKIYENNADKPISELIRLSLKEFAGKDF